ncbi:hypothetical protein Tco_0051430, partial [Tanacetum coccineum]
WEMCKQVKVVVKMEYGFRMRLRVSFFVAERTHAFYLASSDRFKDSIIGVGDLGENYVNLIRVYVSRVKLNIPARIVKLPGKGRYAKIAKKRDFDRDRSGAVWLSVL